MDTTDFPIQPVSAWQGIRNYGENEGQYLICGTSNTVGLLYLGPISGGGQSYTVQYPGADTIATSVYGPDNLNNGMLRVVGSYRKNGTPGTYNYGFVWEGTTNQLPSGGVFRTIAYPGASIQYTHSTMGDLAVGNALGPERVGIAYIYNLSNNNFVSNIVFPGSKTTTAYGIWQNGLTSYTICGGYSPLATQDLTNQNLPLAKGKGYMVDYDSAKKEFSPIGHPSATPTDPLVLTL
jgi:trimeric autotransporter adhesin